MVKLDRSRAASLEHSGSCGSTGTAAGALRQLRERAASEAQSGARVAAEAARRAATVRAACDAGEHGAVGDLGAPGLLLLEPGLGLPRTEPHRVAYVQTVSPPVLEAGSPRSRCQQGREGDLPQAPLLDVWTAISSWGRHKLVPLCLGPSLPSDEDTSPHGVRAPDQLRKGRLQVQSHPNASGLRPPTCLGTRFSP